MLIYVIKSIVVNELEMIKALNVLSIWLYEFSNSKRMAFTFGSPLECIFIYSFQS